MNKWQFLRRYEGLVRLGQAPGFLCVDHRTPLVTMIGPDGDPVLWCSYDDHSFAPGAQFWADVKAVVTEFYLE